MHIRSGQLNGRVQVISLTTVSFARVWGSLRDRLEGSMSEEIGRMERVSSRVRKFTQNEWCDRNGWWERSEGSPVPESSVLVRRRWRVRGV